MLLIFVDVDGLKTINDKFGHEEGDFTIHTIAQVLYDVTDHRMKAARYGGDEFLIFGRGMTHEDGKKVQVKIGEKLLALNESIDKPYEVSASTGCYIKSSKEEMTLDECIKQADKEMYKNKRKKHAKCV